MRSIFKIADDVDTSDVNIGFIDAPILNSSTAIKAYSFAGYHEDNTSTFPNKTRLAGATYSKDKSAYEIDDIWANDALITSVVYTGKGVSRSIPLYLKYVCKIPLKSESATWNNDTSLIVGREALLKSYTILDEDNLEVLKENYMHEVDFIPYHLHNNVSYSDNEANLFYIYIYSNGDIKNRSRKIQFSGLDTYRSTVEVDGTHTEVISLSRIHKVFDTHYRFSKNIGGSTTKETFAEGRLNPKYSDLPDIDPDANAGRAKGYLSLAYSYLDESYKGYLDAPFQSRYFHVKPAPMMVLYYNGVSNEYSGEDVVSISPKYNNYEITIKDPVQAGKSWTYVMTGRSIHNLVKAINNSPAPFTAYSTLPLTNITEEDVFIEYASTFEDSSETSQLYDRNSSGGILIRSNKFVTKYTQDPTINVNAPKGLKSSVSWFPQIKLGGFVARETGAAYYLNEYSAQQWSATYGYPFVDVIAEDVEEMRPRIINLRNKKLLSDPGSVEIYDSTGANLNSYIEDIDAQNGRVFLKKILPQGNEVFVNYVFEKGHFSYKSAELNPVEPYRAQVGKYYNIYITPYLTSNGAIQSSTVYHEVTDSLPNMAYKNEDLLLGSFLIKDTSGTKDYSYEPPTILGGGIRTDLTNEEYEAKVLSPHSLSDSGFYDGRRYPANMVNIVRVPPATVGDSSILIDNYDPDALIPTELKVYNAINIPNGTIIKVFTGVLDNYEEATVVAPIDHNTLKIESALSEKFYIGSRIEISGTIDGLFTREKLHDVVNKFSQVSSHQIIEIF